MRFLVVGLLLTIALLVPVQSVAGPAAADGDARPSARADRFRAEILRIDRICAGG